MYICGIAGLIGGSSEALCRHAHLMAECISHRGPDDEGYLTLSDDGEIRQWSGKDTDASLQLPLLHQACRSRVILAHRRLSILDLSPAGHQPMSDATGRFSLVFNGEIYNYVELRRELAASGYPFRTQTDTEVILAALGAWGERAFRRFRGMFALAALDRVQRRLLLARDPFGVKPLYYATLRDGGFGFASEIKALTALPGVVKSSHARAMFEFLRFGLSDHGDQSVFSDVKQLPGGHLMWVSVDSPSPGIARRFWSLPKRDGAVENGADAGEIVRRALSESVALHMRSDVAVGSCLSGGLDSTAIVAVASEMVPRTRSKFGTVSFISDDPEVSEAPFISLAEREYRIDSHRVTISAEDVRRDFKALVAAQDAPFGSLSIYAQYAVFREAAANKLTVMLDGQGSDELLGGYNTAVSAAIAERVARGELLSALSIARAFNPIGRSAYKRTILSALGRFIPAGIAPGLMTLVNEPLCPRWLDDKWFIEREVRIAVRPQGRGRDALDEELRLFTEDLSLPQLLRFEDRNSMAFGIESRVPFCDSEFATVVASIPTSQLVTTDGQTKAPLRVGFRGLVPDEIIDRRKVGFNAPDEAWLGALKPWIFRELQENAWRLPFLRVELILAAMSRNGSRASDIRQFWRVISAVLWASAFDVQAA